MFKSLALAAVLLVTAVTFGGPAVAHDADPAHYHAGETQPFYGLVCRSRESAMYIFNTWMEVGIDKSEDVFLVYRSADECKFLTRYFAYFIEKIISSIAPYFNGDLKNVIVFSISPNELGTTVDYLVTWENLSPSA